MHNKHLRAFTADKYIELFEVGQTVSFNLPVQFTFKLTNHLGKRVLQGVIKINLQQMSPATSNIPFI